MVPLDKGREIIFEMKKGSYSVNFRDLIVKHEKPVVALNSVVPVKKYITSEIKLAQETYQFLVNAGYPSSEKAIQLLTGGDLNNSHLTKKDIFKSSHKRNNGE